MPGKPPRGTKGIGWSRRPADERLLADISQTGEVHIPDTLIPKAKLSEIQSGSLVVICGEDRVVLHPHMNIVEFREARRQLDVMLLHLVIQRARNAVQS